MNVLSEPDQNYYKIEFAAEYLIFIIHWYFDIPSQFKNVLAVYRWEVYIILFFN